MFCDTAAHEYNSSWDFGAQVNVDNLDPFFDIMVTEVKAALGGDIADKDIESAKSFAIGKHQMDCQTVGQINNWYADRYFFDGHVDNFDEAPKAIKSVTKERIVSVVKEFTEADCWMLGGIGNTDKEVINKLHGKLAALFE
jgi:predicted Zn-dependent peptidase